MALYQPTNITPDLKGGVKNGTILAPQSGPAPDPEFSWTVNGNSQMVAYQIDFYKNDANSTPTGSTNKVTLGVPFSAISANGTETRFSVTVPLLLITQAINGSGTKREGKFKITQWWGSGANEYVEQRSLSVFCYSKPGLLSVNAPSGAGGMLSFTGTYTPPTYVTFGDITLNWTRWELTISNVDVLQDTGKVWGATAYQWNPQQIAPGGNYVVRFTAEASNGAEMVAYYGPFDVLQEDVTTVTGVLQTACDKSRDAVGVIFTQWDGLPSEVSEENDYERISVPGEQYPGAPWHFIWHGFIQNGPLFEITCKNGYVVSVSYLNGILVFSPNESGINWPVVHAGDEATICFTTGDFTQGITSGYQWLAYSDDWQAGMLNAAVNEAGYSQSEVVSLTLYGLTPSPSYTLGFGTNNSGIEAFYNDPDKSPTFDGPKVLRLYSGPAILFLGQIYGGEACYRLDSKGNLVYIGTFEEPPNLDDQLVIYDYSAVNGESYQYMVIENGEENGNAAIGSSGTATPCFWDWVLIEAAAQERWDGSKGQNYKVVQDPTTGEAHVYVFSSNVSTGNYTNGSTRNIQPSFTRYPVVQRSTQNRRQGSLTGLIGKAQGGVYTDSNAVEQAIRALSSSKNQLFLRDRRGNFMRISLAGEISMKVNDNSLAQEITVSIPWVEDGPADGLSVYLTDFIEHFEPEPE